MWAFAVAQKIIILADCCKPACWSSIRGTYVEVEGENSTKNCTYVHHIHTAAQIVVVVILKERNQVWHPGTVVYIYSYILYLYFFHIHEYKAEDLLWIPGLAYGVITCLKNKIQLTTATKTSKLCVL